MLTSGTVSDCNTIPTRSHLINHLEDHEKGEFNQDPTPSFPDYYSLVVEKNRLCQVNAQLCQELQNHVVSPLPISVTESISFINEQNHNLAIENSKLRTECARFQQEEKDEIQRLREVNRDLGKRLTAMLHLFRKGLET